MNTYIIGDLQGCFDSLEALLQKISFDPKKDRLQLLGDIVNRGPKSLETLEYVATLPNAQTVLGNHDLHLLALYFGQSKVNSFHTLHPILKATNAKKHIDWLLSQPFLFSNDSHTYALVHAGIPPQWDILSAKNYAKEASLALQEQPELFLNQMYGNTPAAWSENLTGWDRLRYIVNALTRMRFCTKEGVLDLNNKTNISTHSNYKPWFDWRVPDSTHILFGHWAALKGKCDRKNITALDTGCLWGGKLTAFRMEDSQFFSIPAREAPADISKFD